MSQAREIGGYRSAAARPSLILRDIVLAPAGVATITCAEQIFAVVGVLATDALLVGNKLTDTVGCGAFPQRVSTAGNVAFKFVNPTAGGPLAPAAEVWKLALSRGG